MTELSQIEIQSCTLWLTANYEGDDGEEYEIVFTKTYEDNLGYEEREVGKVENIEVQGYTEWSSATYVDDEGEEFEIVFTKSYTHNIGYEEREVVNVERAGIAIDSADPIWRKIRKAVQEGGDA